MPIVTPLRRTSIVVRNLERSLRFYERALGLTVWRRGVAGPDNVAFATLLGAPPCALRWAVLQSADVEWGMVGLFEIDDPALPEAVPQDPARTNRGEACLVFHAPDVRGIQRVARRLGATVICPPTRLVLPQLGLETLEMTLRDPDGVLLNFIQAVKGGLAPHNRFPGFAKRATGARTRRTSTRPKGGVGKRAAASPSQRSGKGKGAGAASAAAAPQRVRTRQRRAAR